MAASHRLTHTTSRVLTGLGLSLVLLAVLLPQPAPLSGSLTSGPATFTIDNSIAAELSASPEGPECSGPPATLAPGVTRCLVYRVTNQMAVPITVQQITIYLDPAYPSPPLGCAAQDLQLPTFTGSLPVPAGSSTVSPGLPITLKDTGFNQDACQDRVLHFMFFGTAVYGQDTAPDTPQGTRLGTQQGSQPQPYPGGGPLASTGTAVVGVLVIGGVLLLMGLVLLITSQRARAGDQEPR